jgi:hypothetical protein
MISLLGKIFMLGGETPLAIRIHAGIVTPEENGRVAALVETIFEDLLTNCQLN